MTWRLMCTLIVLFTAAALIAQPSSTSSPAPQATMSPMMGVPGAQAGTADTCPCMRAERMMGGGMMGGGMRFGMVLGSLVGLLSLAALALLVVLEVVWIRLGLRRLRQQPA